MAPSLTYAGNDNVEVGRYVTATTKPTAAQINPLLAVVSVTFPSAITTVGDAMNYLLRFSSYTLIPEAQRTPAEKAMLTQPLPLVNRQFQAIPLQEALEVLAGKSVFTLVQDPLHRWVHFRLNQEANRLWREAQ
ncbi:MAG: putative exported protein [Gammaproteobacteria bacterium]|nr:putative exported protein [Gammaproteobacteria bacterium]